MAKKIRTIFTILTIIAMIVLFVLQGIQNSHIKGTNTVRAHQQLSLKYQMLDQIPSGDPNVEVVFYRKDKSGKWDPIVTVNVLVDEALPKPKELSFDRVFYCDDAGRSVSNEINKATGAKIIFTPNRVGEYKCVFTSNGTEMASEEFEIIEQTLWYYIRNFLSGFILTPILMLIVAPIRWIGNNTFWNGLNKLLFCGGFLSFILIILSVIVFFIVMIRLHGAICRKYLKNEPTEDNDDTFWAVFTTFRLSIYLGMLITILIMHSLNYLEQIAGFTETNVINGLLSYGILAFLALIKTIIAIKKGHIKACRLLLVLIEAALISMCLHLGALAVFILIIASFFGGISEAAKDYSDTYTISYGLAQIHRKYNPDVDEDEDTLDVAKRPEYMLPAMYINHKMKKAERQDKDDE